MADNEWDDKPFPCTQCGACCSKPNIDAYPKEIPTDGHFCIHLCHDSFPYLCSIYPTRPDVCNTDVQFKSIVAKYPSYPRWHFYMLVSKECNRLQTLHCLPVKYRIDLQQFLPNKVEEKDENE